MGIGSILLGIALLFVVVLYVGRPFLQGQPPWDEALNERQTLQMQKEALLEQIRILDFEHETGKMPDDEHAQQRAQLLQEAAAVLRALDNLAPAGASNGAAARIDHEIEAAIAAARRAPRSDSAAGPDARTEQEIEAAVQRTRRQAQAPAPLNGPQASGRFCTQCGNPRDAVDKFCAYCGTSFA